MKKILILLTGGTFGMISGADKSLQTKELSGELFNLIPELLQLAQIDVKTIFTIDSSDMQIAHWLLIAEEIEKNLSRYDGFVIIHGTDTMAYTASALSFMLVNLNKPVVLTGSQRPLSEIRSDARMNLINAVEMASYDIPEVSICFDYRLFRGNRAKKVSINEFAAFQSPNFEPLAKIGIDIELSSKVRKPEGLFHLAKKFDSSVISLPLFPGFKSKDLELLIDSDLKAIVFEAFGAGNVPVQDNSFIPLIRKLDSAGKIVAIKSQCIEGSAKLSLYQGGKEALEAGALSCLDMTRECVLVKLMFLLGMMKDVTDVKKAFYRSLAGEMKEIKHV